MRKVEKITLFLMWCYAKFWDFFIGGKTIPGYEILIQENPRNTEFKRRRKND